MNSLKTYINEKLVLNKDNIKNYSKDYNYVIILAFDETYEFYFDKTYRILKNRNFVYSVDYNYFLLPKEDFIKSIDELKKEKYNIYDPIRKNSNIKMLQAWKIPVYYNEEIKNYIYNDDVLLKDFVKDYGNLKAIQKKLEKIDIDNI